MTPKLSDKVLKNLLKLDLRSCFEILTLLMPLTPTLEDLHRSVQSPPLRELTVETTLLLAMEQDREIIESTAWTSLFNRSLAPVPRPLPGGQEGTFNVLSLGQLKLILTDLRRCKMNTSWMTSLKLLE